MSNVLSGVKCNRLLKNKTENDPTEKAKCFEARVRSLAVIISLICSFRWFWGFFSSHLHDPEEIVKTGTLGKKCTFLKCYSTKLTAYCISN